MDELTLLRGLGVDEPLDVEAARTEVWRRLTGATADRPRASRSLGGRVVVVRLVLVAATVAVAAAVALFLALPWSGSPSFLERAEAALTPPEGMILHEKWVTTSISRHPRCRVTSTTEFWLDANSKRVGE